jgi:hypothetical protein
MTKVFIGGSRAVSRLPLIVTEKLDEFIKRNCAILVGDANGADKAVQHHFAQRGYAPVVVYCMDHCRNNLGGWPTKQVARPGARKDFAYYAAKDAAMVQDAKCGVMLWDGKSKGTLNNVQELIRERKKTLVYFAPEKAFHKIVSGAELDAFLRGCNQNHVHAAQQQINAKLANQLPLHAPQS